jgi:hypothetical protein
MATVAWLTATGLQDRRDVSHVGNSTWIEVLEGERSSINVIEEIRSEAEGGGRWRTDLFPEVLQ